MNNLTLPVQFMEVSAEKVSPVHCAARFVLWFGVSLSLVVLPGRAQTSASEQKTVTLEELQQMALQNNPTFRQSAANIQAAEGRKKQSGLYPNPTVGYQGEQIRGGSFHGGEQGVFVQQDIVMGGKLGLNRKIFDQELRQAETEADEQKVRVVTNVRMSYIQALAAQQTLELRQNLSKLADDAVETSHQLANVGQADAPDMLESEVEAQQAQLAVTMAEQNQQRVWKALAAVVGNPRLPLIKLEGKLEDTPTVNADELVEKIVNESPAVRIAELGVKRAEAALARAKREPIPDLQLRGGMQQNGELLSDGSPVGLQGFADVGVRIPIFNRNQGNIATAKADTERAKREVERVKLVLRERAASVVQNYRFSQIAVERYKNQMIPRAQKAYEMYTKKYQEMAAAYPQVLISQRTLMQLEVSYITALENFATSSLSLRSYLLTDGLEAPSQPGGIDQPVREVNIPFQMGVSPQ
ncbi:MAG TPA: TolC family protein [Candidatus Acidoferrales bacterium]|jgi:cobalt-zinc-cadmium efflux system outer membrane protein|nr:TolC family protein [Candidatus Acidoferrales bacterium]